MRGGRTRTRGPRRAGCRGSRTRPRTCAQPSTALPAQDERRRHRRGDRLDLRAHELLVGLGRRRDLRDRRLAVGERVLGALRDRLDRGGDVVAALLERVAADDEHHLGVARGAEVVDAELARLQAALAQHDALGVPEGGRGVHLPGQQVRPRRRSRSSRGGPGRSRRRRPRPRPGGRRRRTGRPATPTSWPSSSRGRWMSRSARAITAASGRCTSAPTPTTSVPFSIARPRSWMSSTAMSARRVASSFSESGLPPAGGRIRMRTPFSSSRPVLTAA